MKHPMQPIYTDVHGTRRFKKNAIVEYLAVGMLNELAAKGSFSNEDWMQLAQLTGHSLTYYSDLPYVSDEEYAVAEALSDGATDERDERIRALEAELAALRDASRDAVAALNELLPGVD